MQSRPYLPACFFVRWEMSHNSMADRITSPRSLLTRTVPGFGSGSPSCAPSPLLTAQQHPRIIKMFKILFMGYSLSDGLWAAAVLAAAHDASRHFFARFRVMSIRFEPSAASNVVGRPVPGSPKQNVKVSPLSR